MRRGERLLRQPKTSKLTSGIGGYISISKLPLEFILSSPYQRLLVHRCAAYHKLSPETDTQSKTIIVSLTTESRMCVLSLFLTLPRSYPNLPTISPSIRIADLVPAESSPLPTIKIMRRSANDRARLKSRSNSGDPDSDEDSTKSSQKRKQDMTIAEREAAYNIARSRIFMDFEDRDRDGTSASSSTQSLVSPSFQRDGSVSSVTSNGGAEGVVPPSESSPSPPKGSSKRSNQKRNGGGEGRNGTSRTGSANSYSRDNGVDASNRSSGFSYPSLYEPSPSSDSSAPVAGSSSSNQRIASPVPDIPPGGIQYYAQYPSYPGYGPYTPYPYDPRQFPYPLNNGPDSPHQNNNLASPHQLQQPQQMHNPSPYTGSPYQSGPPSSSYMWPNNGPPINQAAMGPSQHSPPMPPNISGGVEQHPSYSYFQPPNPNQPMYYPAPSPVQNGHMSMPSLYSHDSSREFSPQHRPTHLPLQQNQGRPRNAGGGHPREVSGARMRTNVAPLPMNAWSHGTGLGVPKNMPMGDRRRTGSSSSRAGSVSSRSGSGSGTPAEETASIAVSLFLLPSSRTK